MSRNTIYCTLLFLGLALSVNAQVPDKPTEKKLLWDYAGIIDDYQEQVLEDSLEAFSRNTSNQIVVMTVSSFGDLTPADFGYEVGQKWGVGQKGKDNGVVILIKPKTGEGSKNKGQAFITTGYGAEGPLPDLLCSRIVSEVMIPHFKENDYAGGVWAALEYIKPALQGDFNEAENLGSDAGDAILAMIVLIAIICFIFIVFSKDMNGGNGNGNNTRTYTGGPIIFPTGWNSGSSRGGSFGGGFGGGGGWGGFGGGSFGGGGGGGSW
jgi:uncharacterized protein